MTVRWWRRRQYEQRISEIIPRLYSIASSWGCTRDTCDDLVQETVTTALDKLEQLRDPQAFQCWVIRILVNSHRQYLRRHRWLTTLDDEQLVEELGPSRRLESTRTVDRVRAAIGLLSDEHRKVLVLVDMEGMSYREVSDVLEIKLGTVMSRLGRARKRLRGLLGEFHDERIEQADARIKPSPQDQSKSTQKQAKSKLWSVK